ncbi:MAG: 50S ribosomal protein L29 [Candidatus Paceibacterota bacterium]|jgi:ribosomal protein L29
MATKHTTTHRKEVQDSGTDALKKMLGEKREALKNFRFGVSGARVKNVKASSVMKRDIARILTKLNEKK